MINSPGVLRQVVKLDEQSGGFKKNETKERDQVRPSESVPQSAGLGELKMSSSARFAPEIFGGFKKVMKCDQ